MKGIIFNLLQEIVEQEYGEKTWDALLAAAKLEGAYTSLGSYPDADLMKLVAAASAALGQPPDDIVRWVGRKAVPLPSMGQPMTLRIPKNGRLVEWSPKPGTAGARV